MIEATMPIDVQSAAGPASQLVEADRPADQASFLREMVRKLDPTATDRQLETPEGLANLAAQRLVSTTFLEPLVRDAREATTPTGRFAPGTAETRFGHLLDRRFADAISASPDFGPVASMERHLLTQIRRSLAAKDAGATSS